MVVNEKYTNELNRLLSYMEEELAKEELPTPILTTDYFILAIFNQRESRAYKRLDNFITADSMSLIHNTYFDYLRKQALSVIKPDRKIKYDDKFTSYLNAADKEREKINVPLISSEHVLLAILNDETEDNQLRRLFKKIGVGYMNLFDKIVIDNDGNNLDKPTSIEDEEKAKAFKKILGLPDNAKIKIVNNSSMINPMMGPDSMMDEANPDNAKRGKAVELYCNNLNDLAERGLIDPLVGRENETKEIIRVLGRRRKNNAILLGGEGVGKTAIGENLAYKIVKGEVPMFLLNKKVISLDMTALIGGTTLRGMFEARVKSLLNEIKSDGNYILFIDNIGSVFANNGKNDYDISSMMSHSLDNGEVQIIGTSDYKSYRTTFDKDPSLGRRFQKIIVETPSIEDSIDILNGIQSYYADYHKVTFTSDAVNSCVKLANRYISERNLPDSAIDLMDEAGAMVSMNVPENQKIETILKEIKNLKYTIEDLKNKDDYNEADNLEKDLHSKSLELIEVRKTYEEERNTNRPIIDADVILQIVSMKTGIPVNKLTADDKQRLSTINERLKSEIIGQDEAIDTICKAIKRNRVGLSNSKCLYSTIEIGKTGVGKTLVAKKLAKEMFGDENALIRFDMSEYPDKSAVNKLIGSNPGYIGYEEGGQLTEAIKNKKHCVLLLDEIEKADPEVYNIFLQVLDEGFLTDNSGMKVDFKNVIVIFTSNVGAKAASDFGKGIGFGDNTDENSKRILLKELKNKFPPEFLNRLDNIVYFNNLTDDNLKGIIKIEIGKLTNKINNIGYNVNYDDSTLDYILSIAKEQKEFGARPIIRIIQDEIGDKITDLLLEKEYNKNYTFNISCLSNELTIV